MPSYRQRKNGTWVVRWDERDPVTGQRRQPEQPGFPTKRAAESWWHRKAIEIERRAGRSLPAVTVAEWAASWLRSIRHTVAPNTYTTYEGSIRLHISPHLGDIMLGKLTPARVRQWHGELLAKGLAPQTVSHHHSTLNRLLKQAERDGALDRNPAADNWPAVPEHGPRSYLDEAERRRFLALTDPAIPMHLIWRVALYTGMRTSELLGLRWLNVDRQRGVLRVVGQLAMYGGGDWELRRPKTRRAVRTLSLSRPIVDELSAHYRRQLETRLMLAELWQDHGLVFTRANGLPVPRQTVWEALQAFCRAHDFAPISMHALRRTHATWLAALGEHPSVIQHRLGHASSRMAMDAYQQVSDTMDRQAARLLEQDGDAPHNRNVGT